MSTKLFDLLIAVAYRRAKNNGGRLWWTVFAAASAVRLLDARAEKSSVYRVRDGHDIDVAVRKVT